MGDIEGPKEPVHVHQLEQMTCASSETAHLESGLIIDSLEHSIFMHCLDTFADRLIDDLGKTRFILIG